MLTSVLFGSATAMFVMFVQLRHVPRREEHPEGGVCGVGETRPASYPQWAECQCVCIRTHRSWYDHFSCLFSSTLPLHSSLNTHLSIPYLLVADNRWFRMVCVLRSPLPLYVSIIIFPLLWSWELNFSPPYSILADHGLCVVGLDLVAGTDSISVLQQSHWLLLSCGTKTGSTHTHTLRLVLLVWVYHQLLLYLLCSPLGTPRLFTHSSISLQFFFHCSRPLPVPFLSLFLLFLPYLVSPSLLSFFASLSLFSLSLPHSPSLLHSTGRDITAAPPTPTLNPTKRQNIQMLAVMCSRWTQPSHTTLRRGRGGRADGKREWRKKERQKDREEKRMRRRRADERKWNIKRQRAGVREKRKMFTERERERVSWKAGQEGREWV